MKILIINKFLHPNGGSETYIFEIGTQLQKMGHEVQYFGMENENRIVGNRVNCYTTNMDFHTGKYYLITSGKNDLEQTMRRFGFTVAEPVWAGPFQRLDHVAK